RPVDVRRRHGHQLLLRRHRRHPLHHRLAPRPAVGELALRRITRRHTFHINHAITNRATTTSTGMNSATRLSPAAEASSAVDTIGPPTPPVETLITGRLIAFVAW